jgi:heat shock protein HslJ
MIARKQSLPIVAIVLAVAACTTAASPSGPSLTGGTWQLAGFTEVVPAAANVIPEAEKSKYTVTFNTDGSVDVVADCNNSSGTYVATSTPGAMKITLGPTTLAFCPEGSLSDAFLVKLQLVTSYEYAGSDLILAQSDGGTMSFSPA